MTADEGPTMPDADAHRPIRQWPTRRRAITLMAASAGMLAAMPGRAVAGDGFGAPVVWRGTAMGAEATIQLFHADRAFAEASLAAALDEIERLETLFSLHRPDSVLSRLNRTGRMQPAPPDFVELVRIALGVAAATEGAFDPTVQPLWSLYANHFAKPDADPAGPTDEAIATRLGRIGPEGVIVDEGSVRFARTGMALTLNGIAQGFITDRLCDRLRTAGFSHALVNLGEYRAIGGHPDGRPWRLGIMDAEHPLRTIASLDVDGQAVATSAGLGTVFEPSGRHHHLFNPRTGRSAHDYKSVTVRAPRATVADALSTALATTAPGKARAMLDRFAPAGALLRLANGRLVRLGL